MAISFNHVIHKRRKRFHIKFQVHCSNNLLLIHWTWWTWYARNDFIISSHNLIISVLFNFRLLLIPHWEMILLFSQRIRVRDFTPNAQQILRISQRTENNWMYICRRDPMTQITMKSDMLIFIHNVVCDSTQTFNDNKSCWVHMWIKL